jgi:glutamyl-tRNA synthetase
MIHGADGKKLSKRHGATAVGDYRHLGILPQAMLNFLALLGWAPGHDIEIMTPRQMVELFSADGLSKKAAIFDTKKLEWMNGQHLSHMEAAALAEIVTPAILGAGYSTTEHLATNREWYHSILDLLKVRARTVDDIVRQATPYFPGKVTYDTEAVAKGWKDRTFALETLRAVREALESAAWEPKALETAVDTVAEQRATAPGKIYQPMRVALTGMTASPGIFEVLLALGKDLALDRLDEAISALTL